MATQYGLTSKGFVAKAQQVVISEIESALQAVFGANINLGAESVFGQIFGIFSEREALLWQLGEAIYSSQYPSGAEGTSVDNILALNNLKRLGASPTKTNSTPDVQSNGITLYGLVLYGTPGTTVTKTSIIKTTASPPLSFTLDADVIIQAALNAQQSIFFGNSPNMGAFALSIVDTAGNTLTTGSIPYTALVNQTQLSFSGTPVTGNFTLTLTQAGSAQTTANIPYTATNATVQTAIRALTGYSGVTVSGSFASGFVITWGSISNPTVVVASNTLAVTITEIDSVQSAINQLEDTTAVQTTGTTVSGSPALIISSATGVYPGMGITGTGIPANTVVNSISGNTVTMSQNATASGTVTTTFQNFWPYTDVTMTGSFSGGSFVATFGGGTAIGTNPSSGSQPQALMTLASNTLQNGSTVTNINIVNTTVGAPAQGTGSATCTETGPNFVKAGTLTVIGSPTSGWTSVTNQLDCITGSNTESDTDALTRRDTLLAAQANGPLQSIVEKVLKVSGVTAAEGFSNLTGAAQQIISFASTPSSGHWGYSVLGQTTANLAYNCTDADVQTALQALTGLSSVLVTGSISAGFVIDFNGANGGQAIPLGTVVNNTTGVTISSYFGRPPNSFEIVVEGGADSDIANAIYGAQPAGIQAYGSPVLRTTGSPVYGSTTLSLASTTGLAAGMAIFGLGVANGATIVSVGVGSVVMSLPALGNYSNIDITINHTITLYDKYNNPVLIGFSRPQQVTMYVSISLTTDIYNTPGNSSSGSNPNSKFNPKSITQIQNDIVAIGNAVQIGGLIVGFGSNGLIGAFNDIPGIVSYTLFFGTSPNPTSNSNIQIQSGQQALFETFNVTVTFT